MGLTVRDIQAQDARAEVVLDLQGLSGVDGGEVGGQALVLMGIGEIHRSNGICREGLADQVLELFGHGAHMV